MTLVPDEHVLAPALLAESMPTIHALLPGAMVESDGFDLFVTVDHPGTRPVLAETAYALARALRGGMDHDEDRPAEWHVRSLSLRIDLPVLPHLAPMGPPRPLGTKLWLSRSYAAPKGYRETDRTPGERNAQDDDTHATPHPDGARQDIEEQPATTRTES